jgi:hypothetical protein
MKLKILITLLFVGLIDQGCGVRGDPVPPKNAPILGRGQPTYKGATQDLAFPTVPPVYAPKSKDKEDENEKK